MIEGITVLSESTFKVTWWEALGLAIVVAIVSGCIIAAIEKDWNVGMFAGVIIFVLVFVFVYFPNRRPLTTYKVLIDDNVSMKEFDELYEVLDHDGDIVIIKMKEQNDEE